MMEKLFELQERYGAMFVFRYSVKQNKITARRR